MRRDAFLKSLAALGVAGALPLPSPAATVPKKVSVYGDSTCLSQQGSQSRAERIYRYNPAKFSGYNDFAHGGNSLAKNLTGDCDGFALFQGRTFQQQMDVDDCDIVVINLGGNDQAGAMSGGLLSTSAEVREYKGSDMFGVGLSLFLHIGYALSAGKRVVVVGIPFVDAPAIAANYGLTQAQAEGFLCRAVLINASLRDVAAFRGVPYVATYGAPMLPGQPPADASSVWDGMHPTLAYSHAVSDFLAQAIINQFSL